VHLKFFSNFEINNKKKKRVSMNHIVGYSNWKKIFEKKSDSDWAITVTQTKLSYEKKELVPIFTESMSINSFWISPEDQNTGKFLSGKELADQLWRLSNNIPGSKQTKNWGGHGKYISDLLSLQKNIKIDEDRLKGFLENNRITWIKDQLGSNKKGLFAMLRAIGGDLAKAQSRAKGIIEDPNFRNQYMIPIRTLPSSDLTFKTPDELNKAIKNLNNIADRGFYQTTVTADRVNPNQLQELSGGAVMA
jgi:hypothetical protein